MTKAGGKEWFFVTSDYAFGHALERDAMAVLAANSGKVVGKVRHPVSSSDLSSFLLQAQASKAQVIGFANTASDFANSVRQAKEFGIVEGGQKLAGLLSLITDVHSLGLETAQGMQLTESFYWDLNDETRAFSKRFAARRGGRKPTMIQAAMYSATAHYLKAVAAANTVDGPTVAAKMHEMPVNDFMTKNAKIWPSGWAHRDFYLFEVKSPKESKGEWDYYKLVSPIPADDARPKGSDDDCPLNDTVRNQMPHSLSGMRGTQPISDQYSRDWIFFHALDFADSPRSVLGPRTLCGRVVAQRDPLHPDGDPRSHESERLCLPGSASSDHLGRTADLGRQRSGRPARGRSARWRTRGRLAA